MSIAPFPVPDVKSLRHIDVLKRGLLRRVDNLEPTSNQFTLTDYGFLECPATAFTFSLPGASISPNEEDRTIVITDSNNVSIMLKADGDSFREWVRAFHTVTTPSGFHVSSRVVIHKGHHCVIFKGFHESEKFLVAVKAMSRKLFPIRALVESLMTKYLAKQARNAYPYGLTKCFATYHTRSETHSVMELSSANLQQWIDQHGPLTEEMAQSIVIQIASALDYLHKRGIVHGGVCLDHVMVRNKVRDANLLEVRLAGFSSAWFKDKKTDQWVPSRTLNHMRKGRKGVYLSPECLRGVMGPGLDFWALGVMLYCILVGRLPFVSDGDQSETDAEKALLSYASLTQTQQRRVSLFRPGDATCKNLSGDAKSFLLSMLSPILLERPNDENLLVHPWLLGAAMPVKRKKEAPLIFSQVPP